MPGPRFRYIYFYICTTICTYAVYICHPSYLFVYGYIYICRQRHPCGGVWTMMGLALREQLERHMLHWNSAILGTMMGFPGPVVCCAYVPH